MGLFTARMFRLLMGVEFVRRFSVGWVLVLADSNF